MDRQDIGRAGCVYIIAEMSANHLQSFENAKKIVEAAKKCGVDAVKLQTYTPDTQTISSRNKEFSISGTIWDGKNLYELYQEAYTPWEWQKELKEYAMSLGLDCFSTASDILSVDFLESIGMPMYKVSSFEVVDLPLLRRIGATKKPVILSTGMATLAEIDEAVNTLRSSGTTELALLKCTSAYPAPYEEIHLNTIPHLRDAFNCPVGISDHTLGTAVSVASVALGASVIEKHITLSRDAGGPDAEFSMEPAEFKALVDDVRNVEKALGSVCYGVTPAQRPLTAFRRSLYVVKDVLQGEFFTEKNVKSIRPSNGLHPRMWDVVLDSKAACDIAAGTPLKFNHILSRNQVL